jgi:hypothetical protein
MHIIGVGSLLYFWVFHSIRSDVTETRVTSFAVLLVRYWPEE